MYDLIIQNGTIIDGSGSEPYKGDLAIVGTDIVEIGEVSPENGHKVIDASGLTVTPGFIDMHSHSDLQLFKKPVALQKISQGITTELLGQDGLGVAPVKDDDKELLIPLVSGLLGTLNEESWHWNSMASFLEELSKYPLINNQAVLASHGPIRMTAMKMEDRTAQSKELKIMSEALDKAMEEGAFGLSTGLIYPPCSFADTEEMVELTRVVSRYGGVFVVHLRDEGYYLREALQEMIDVCTRSGAHLHVSHLQAYGKVNWKHVDTVLEMISEFNNKGKISFDRYPYLAGSTVLTAVLPAWVLEGGASKCVSRLKDPQTRQRIHKEFYKGLDIWHNRAISVGWDNIIVCSLQKENNKWMEGLSVDVIAEKVEKNPIDAVCDLLIDENLDVTMISHYGAESNLHKILRHPVASIGTDGIFSSKPHPRLYGTYPRLLGHYVRELKLLSLPEAIKMISAWPAEILGLEDRGLLKEGLKADITILNAKEIKDTGTFENPHCYPEGIVHVIVNGSAVIENEKFTGCLSGKVLKRT